ncbi:DUF3375 family protein [Streptosporangium canum]|uniref:DUF3375 family protein n=1 Tax=Streptosporangium canum TaxID=324952 RepID=UPI0036CB4FE0
MAKSAESYFYEFSTNAAADAAISLLRSKDALLHLALMAAHLGDGQIVDGTTLAALLGEDVLVLQGSLTGDDAEGPSLAVPETLLRKWTKKGWVHRSVDPQTRIERYQLTSGASQAVRQMRSLQRYTSIATESALAMVMAEIRQIAAAANPDPAVRRRAIEEQIALLVAQRDLLEAGEVPQAHLSELIDKIAALAQLIERIPTDVARYGEQMHANTAALLSQSLTDDPSTFADTLLRMFEGHDVIAASAEGQAFRAFANLVGNPIQRSQLETDIGEVLTHVRPLPAHLAETLEAFIDTMWRRMREVEEVRKSAFRRMNNFVRGGDALHYRGMRTRITEAQAAAAQAFGASHGGRDIGFAVPMSTVMTTSVGRLRLDEAEAALPDPVADTGAEFTIDPAKLAGRESIDWVALRAAVHAALDMHDGYATLPEVLEQLPAPRTGDVIGIWSLASRHATVDETAVETVLAHTSRGLRELIVPYLVFDEQMPAPIAAGPRRGLPDAPVVATLNLEGSADA